MQTHFRAEKCFNHKPTVSALEYEFAHKKKVPVFKTIGHGSWATGSHAKALFNDLRTPALT